MTTEDEGLRRVLDAMVPTDEEKAAAVLVSALEDARAKAKAAAAEAKEPWTIDPLLTDVAADAVRVDPENVTRWLLLANRLGAVTVAKMLVWICYLMKMARLPTRCQLWTLRMLLLRYKMRKLPKRWARKKVKGVVTLRGTKTKLSSLRRMSLLIT